jgi:hypothetical protein
MPICPVCRRQYDPPEAFCQGCNSALVESLPLQETGDDARDLNLVKLAGFSNVAEAEMIKELLDQNEVPTILRGEIDPIGVPSGAESTALLIQEKDLQRGQEIFDAYFADKGLEQSDTDCQSDLEEKD